jgi:enoyl-CoA hydratase
MMGILTRTMHGRVAVVTMDDGKENRFNPTFRDALEAEMRELSRLDDVGAVIVTGGGEKFFSNGLDLDWLKAQQPERIKRFLLEIASFLKDTVLYPKPLLAVVNGHAFGLGSIWASAMDFRFARSDRGWICFPEFDVNVPCTPGMLAVCEHGTGKAIIREMLWTGKRYSGTEAAQLGWAREAWPKEELLGKAVEFAAFMAEKRQPAFAITKRRWAVDAVKVIEEREAVALEGLRL